MVVRVARGYLKPFTVHRDQPAATSTQPKGHRDNVFRQPLHIIPKTLFDSGITRMDNIFKASLEFCLGTTGRTIGRSAQEKTLSLSSFHQLVVSRRKLRRLGGRREHKPSQVRRAERSSSGTSWRLKPGGLSFLDQAYKILHLVISLL